MSSKKVISNEIKNANHSHNHPDHHKEQALLDETMKLIAGYEEGLTARDFKGMADCTCGLEEAEHKHKTISKKK